MKYFIEDTTLTAIADAIRSKDGTTEPILTEDMASRIDAIESGGDTSVEDGLITRTLTEYTNGRVTTIGKTALRHCAELTKVDLPNVTYADTQAFYGCSKLVDVNMPLLEELNGQCFQNCTGLKKISLPKLKRMLNSCDFQQCTSLTDVDLPLLEYVTTNPFYQCTALRVLRLPSLKTISTGGLAQLSTSLHTVELNVLTNLYGGNNFNKCTSLNCIILRSETVCSLANVNSFTNTPFRNGTGGIAYVPSALIEEYQSATNWTALESVSYRAIEDWEERIDINTQPTDITGAVGDNIYFTVDADGMGLDYRWQTSKDKGVTWGDNSGVTADYRVPVKASYNGYMVRCIITNINGVEVISDAVTLTVTTE